MKKSNFQFTTPKVTALEFLANIAFDVDKNKSVNIPVSFQNNIKRAPETVAEIESVIKIGEKTEDYPFFLSLTISASFKWEENVYSEDEIKILLEKNAISLLISYARPAVAAVTNFSPFNSYNIPFIDMT